MANIIFWNSFAEAKELVRPYGPHCLAQWLIHNGHTAHVIDFCNVLTLDQLIAITERHIGKDTIAIGVSTTFWQPRRNFQLKPRLTPISTQHEPEWVVNARNTIARKYPNLQWILGGPNAGLHNKIPVFDWTVFWGSAEDALLKFVQDHVGTPTNTQFDITTSSCKYPDGLSIQPTEVVPMELARGCQFKCKFCSYPFIGKKKGTYIRDPSMIEDDLLRNYEKYGTTSYLFLEDTVNESVEKLEALANIAQRLPFKLTWSGYTRLDLIGSQPDTIPILEASGLVGTFFGIESFHPEASKAVGKGWNGKHGKEFLLELMCRWRYKVNMTLGLIIGLPKEPFVSILQTHKWCIDNKIHSWRFAPLVIDRTSNNLSEFAKNYSQYGYRFPKPLTPEYWESDLWNQKSAVSLAKELHFGKLKPDTMIPSAWTAVTYLALGYTQEEILTLNFSRIDYDQAYTQFVEKYVKSQLE